MPSPVQSNCDAHDTIANGHQKEIDRCVWRRCVDSTPVPELVDVDFDVEDAPRSGRPVEADKDVIKALVDANRRITTREIGLRLNLSNSTVYDHLKGLGLSSKLDVWVPHVLTERIASQTSRK
ncbi:histone-lysine N-methyltransferase SETMAR [Trichonephila clavipes]|nr:histone-lysine N-methyltransferase SETMAR [Trichonephila clavipes]